MKLPIMQTLRAAVRKSPAGPVIRAGLRRRPHANNLLAAAPQPIQRAFMKSRAMLHPAGSRQDLIERMTNGMVIRGPFSSMVFTPGLYAVSATAKLLGTYEEELKETVDMLATLKPRYIINIGCGDGYYAVGFALRCPEARILAFDTEASARATCSANAILNGVADRLRMGGGCTTKKLSRLPLKGSLLIVDCEGYETELLDPHQVTGLLGSYMLVELHDNQGETRIRDILISRFVSTHTVASIASRERDYRTYPELCHFDPTLGKAVIDEFRGSQVQDHRWLLLSPVTERMQN